MIAIKELIKEKKCGVCNKLFTPFNSLQQVCGMKCAITHCKNVKKENKVRLKKLDKIAHGRGKLKGDLDKVVSQIVRKNTPYCVVCGSTKELSNGHLISRVIFRLRWDTRNDGNCHTQCWPCNYLHETEPHHYTNWYITTYGLEKYKNLIEESKIITHYKDKDLEELLLNKKKELKELTGLI